MSPAYQVEVTVTRMEEYGDRGLYASYEVYTDLKVAVEEAILDLTDFAYHYTEPTE